MTKGNYGKTPLKPTFTQSTANTYYKDKYSHETPINIENLDWFHKVQEPEFPYDLSPYTEDDIKEALKKKLKIMLLEKRKFYMNT